MDQVERRLPFLARPVVPVAGITALAFSATLLQTPGTDWPLVGAAATLALFLCVVALVVPWTRVPPPLLLLLPVACDGVIAVLRHAQGGSQSGYGPLAMLPVVWAGLALSLTSVIGMTACTAALFGLPITLFPGSLYPSSGFRGVVLWTVVAFLVGVVANRVLAASRQALRLADTRARELDRLVQTQRAIATAEFDLDAVMRTVVAEALELTSADAAVLEVPEGPEMVYRAAAGTALPHVGLRIPLQGSLSGEALRRRRVLVCGDTEDDPRVDREACRGVEVRSLIVVPLLHEARTTGVLKVSSSVRGAFDAADVRVLEGLANTIGAALVRGELLRKLEEQASTDELTGLPNRRAFDDAVRAALARARRAGQPLSILLVDLDGLKQVNDSAGHAAGDRLLVTAGSAWAATLRASDVIARVGGDEFAVLLEGADETAADEVIERLAAALPPGHGASAGAATWDGSEEAAALLARADAAMYECKRARRSRAALRG